MDSSPEEAPAPLDTGEVEYWPVVIGIAAAVMVALWGGLYLLARRLPPGPLRDLAAFLPDCVTVARRLAADPRVPCRVKIALGIAVVWVLSPIDLIPEFIPLIGPLDDVIVVFLALRYTARAVPREAIVDCCPGEAHLLRRLLCG